MSDAKQCCFETIGNNRCRVTQNLNRILILDPEYPVKERWGCYDHLKVFINEQSDDVLEKLKELDFLKAQMDKSRELDKLHRIQAEVSGSRYKEIRTVEDRKTNLKKRLDYEIKNLRTNTCRRLACRKEITNDQIKCVIEVRTHFNTLRVNLPYHRDCLFPTKHALGFHLPIHNKQFTLEQTI